MLPTLLLCAGLLVDRPTGAESAASAPSSPPPAAATTQEQRTLQQAFATHDIDGLARAADRLGVPGLDSLLSLGPREVTLAALAAVPQLASPFALSEPLLTLAGSGDRELALAAATALVSMSRSERSRPRASTEIGLLAETADACATLATRDGAFVDVRVLALDCALDLLDEVGATARHSATDLTLSLLADDDPELIRAAATIADTSLPGVTEALGAAALTALPSHRAAATAAAATLCRQHTASAEVARRATQLATDRALGPADRAALSACAR